MKAVLTRLSFAVADVEQTIEDSAKAGLLISSPETLREAGFNKHHLSSNKTTTYDLAVQAVKRLYDDPARLEDVDAIIYSSCIPENSNIGSVERFKSTRDVKFLMDYPASHLQADFKMKKAVVFGITQQACTGLLGAIRMGQLLIQGDSAFKKILCLTSDRFPPGAIYEQSYNLISDGSAACIIERGETATEGASYQVISCHQLTNGAMAQASDDETVGHFFNYIHRLVLESLQRAKLNPQDIRWIVPQNTNIKAWQILTRLLRVDFDRVALKTLGQVGHMISGDNIVNLIELEKTNQVQSGDYLLLLMAGFGLNWQSVILRRN